MSIIFHDFLTNGILSLKIVISLASISSFLGFLELVRLKEYFKDENIFSWKIEKIELENRYTSKLIGLVDVFCRYPNILYVLVFQLLLTLLITFLVYWGTSTIFLGVLCLLISFCYFLVSFRGFDGFNGGDSMAKIIFLAASVGFLSGKVNLALYFISFQIIFTYSLAGWFKLFEKKWYTGEYLIQVLRQKTYGRKIVWKLLHNKKILQSILSTSVVLFESFFFTIIFLPEEWQIFYILSALIFHICNALVMGLSAFVFSFCATYPALIWSLSKV